MGDPIAETATPASASMARNSAELRAGEVGHADRPGAAQL